MSSVSNPNLQDMRPSEAARRLDRIVEADPANLAGLRRYSKTGQLDTSFNRHIYVLLVIIPLLSAISGFFYLIAYVDGKFNGTPDQELDNIIQANLRSIVR